MGCFQGLYAARVDKTRTDREGSKETEERTNRRKQVQCTQEEKNSRSR